MSSNGETIKILRSNNSGSAPSLTAGEIAVNMADKKLFVGTENGTNVVFRDESYVVGGVAGVSSVVIGSTSLTGNVRFTSTDFSISGGTVDGAWVLQVGLTGTVARIDKSNIWQTGQSFAPHGIQAGYATVPAIYTIGGDGASAGIITIGDATNRYPYASGIKLLVTPADETYYSSTIKGGSVSGDRTIQTPDDDGVIALTKSVVSSLNGFTGAISLSGDGGAIRGSNSVIGARIASYSVTGVASFDSRYFSVGSSGHLALTGSYQATGNTVTTPNGNSGIAIEVSNSERKLTNIGVTGIAIAGTAITLTGGISLTGSGGVSITRTNNQLTISSSVGGGATGDTILPDGQPGVTDGAIWVSTVSGNTKRVTARMTTSVLVGANGIPSGMPGANTGLAVYFENNVEHGKTGVAYFNDAHFLVRPQYGLVNLRNPFFGFAPDSGMTTITGGSGEDQYTFDIDSLSEMTVGMVEPTDYVLVYDASLTNGNKTRKIPVSKLILDTDILFETANSDQLIKTKSASAISYEIVTAPVTADSQSLLKSGDAYSYITQNTAASINGCTGAFTITGTSQEVTVTTGINCQNIIIGLPDNVSIPYLSGTGATFTQTITASRVIGIVSGGEF